MRVAILRTQVPFIYGGAEALAQDLKERIEQTNIHGKRLLADVISVPFLWYPPLELINQITLWRLLNLRECDGVPIDLVIPLKFPTYFVQHPHIRPWIAHQHRQAYDLYETPYGDLHQTADGRDVAHLIRQLDTDLLKTLPLKVISKTVQTRLKKFNQVDSQVLYPPPPHMEMYQHIQSTYENFILVPGRLDNMKRQQLLLKALPAVPNLRLVIIGNGPKEREWKQLCADLGIADRVEWLGWVTPLEKVELYQRCLGVYNAPYHEDYGYVTVEAFLCRKPVLTTDDAGGVLEFVTHNETGIVSRPDQESVTEALITIAQGGKTLCERLGMTAFDLVSQLHINWDDTLKALIG